MEPLNDQELDNLLQQWQARPAPDSITRKVMQARRGTWWKWLLTGSIRIPVPLAFALCAALLLMLAVVYSRSPEKQDRSEFQPVKRLEPRIIRSSYESNN